MNCNPVLVKVNRGTITESFHRGAICVVNHLKEPIYSQGDIHQLCYPRSSMKFFQQIPLLALGGAEKFDLSLEEIAILCGSHNGEKQHVETVQKILNKGGFTEEDLEGKVCFGGLDLSSVGDFTAACYLFPYLVDDVRKFRAIWRIYCPEDTLTERIKKLDIDLMGWIKAGWIRTTPGNVIDHEFVFADIKRDSQKFVIKELGYDRWSAAWIVQQLQTELGHIELFPVNQSMQGMTNATKGVTMALKQGRIEHNGNPIAGWMAGNAVPFYDAKENMMLHKGKSKDKIDGIIAMIIAYAQAEVGNPVVEKKFSVYDDLNFERVMEEIEGHKIGDNQK